MLLDGHSEVGHGDARVEERAVVRVRDVRVRRVAGENHFRTDRAVEVHLGSAFGPRMEFGVDGQAAAGGLVVDPRIRTPIDPRTVVHPVAEDEAVAGQFEAPAAEVGLVVAVSFASALQIRIRGVQGIVQTEFAKFLSVFHQLLLPDQVLFVQLELFLLFGDGSLSFCLQSFAFFNRDLLRGRLLEHYRTLALLALPSVKEEPLVAFIFVHSAVRLANDELGAAIRERSHLVSTLESELSTVLAVVRIRSAEE